MNSDSIESGKPSISFLGQIYDPYFGTTTAEFVSQIRLGSSWDDKYFVIDSVKLYLRLLTVKGAVDKPHYLRLSEIANQIYDNDSVKYYSNQTVPLTGYSVPDILLPELKPDTINDIVLDVGKPFGLHLTSDTSMFFHSESKPDFRSYFKGLYFQLISPEEPIFVSLSVAPPDPYSSYYNYFIMYMRNENDEQKTFIFVLDAISRNAAFNLFRHNYDDADPLKKIQHINDTNYHDTLSYAQTFNGVYTKLLIPGLENIKNDPSMDNISVNKARLKFPIVYDNDIYTRSTIPSQLYLRYITTSGAKYLIHDYSISPTLYDGTPDTTANVYNLNIATFVQKYLDDKENEIKPELDLLLSSYSQYNVILKANSGHPKVKFELTYTKF
jgi:hypothetical protein